MTQTPSVSNPASAWISKGDSSWLNPLFFMFDLRLVAMNQNVPDHGGPVKLAKECRT